MAVAWTVNLVDCKDWEDHFAVSTDGGRNWGTPRSTGIRGQTMTPLWWSEDRLLVLYNRRYGAQAVLMCLVRLAERAWRVEWEDVFGIRWRRLRLK